MSPDQTTSRTQLSCALNMQLSECLLVVMFQTRTVVSDDTDANSRPHHEYATCIVFQCVGRALFQRRTFVPEDTDELSYPSVAMTIRSATPAMPNSNAPLSISVDASDVRPLAKPSESPEVSRQPDDTCYRHRMTRTIAMTKNTASVLSRSNNRALSISFPCAP